MTLQYDNLKYAQRAGSDITLRCMVKAVYPVRQRGSVVMRELDITDGRMTAKLVLFGDVTRVRCRAGDMVVVGPVYYNGEYDNFVLKRGGTIFVG